MEFQAAWIEIPVSDINRAAKFYGEILGKSLEVADDGERKIAMLTASDYQGVGASINETKDFYPHKDGVLIYISADGTVEDAVSRIEAAGGKIIIPKTSMGTFGFYVTFSDSEGNTLALWSRS